METKLLGWMLVCLLFIVEGHAQNKNLEVSGSHEREEGSGAETQELYALFQ